ncbi:MAG: molybdenum cofactor biosynthesis protein MoaE [Gammaproteobacteria bacterium]
MVILLQETFDPWQQMQHYQSQQDWQNSVGATAVFVGTMRDFNEGDSVSGMLIEHYPEMTAAYLEALVTTSIEQYQLLDCLIIHRTGSIKPADAIVLVACWSAHRAAAFDASRAVMEKLKSEAPLWKKETLLQGSRWVEKNTPDANAF